VAARHHHDDVVPAVTRVKSPSCLVARAGTASALAQGQAGKNAVVELWADLLTDRELLLSLMRNDPEMRVSESDNRRGPSSLVTRVAAIVARDPRELPPEEKKRSPAKSRADKRGARRI